jgi:hypothetical protein
MTEQDAQVHAARQSIYGPWETNMAGTSAQLDGLRIQWEGANPGKPLPAWWAPLSMVLVKANRIASGVYHADNFVDLRVYLNMVETTQKAERA